jgi:predicted Rossmann fold flavoprotein
MSETRPALVPFTFADGRFTPLAGVSLPVTARANDISFDEGMLFTHRGLSGPAILQISSYWNEGDSVSLRLAPAKLYESLRAERGVSGKTNLTKAMARHLPSRLVDFLATDLGLIGNLADQSDARLKEICDTLANWPVTPTGSEGYRTAEVTLGGISTDALNSKDMQAKTVPGLFAIGEAVDVTGWLGGFNFQWAWSSGWAAGTAIAAQRTAKP